MPVYLDRLVTTLDAAAMTGCGRAPVRAQGANRPLGAAIFRPQISADCRQTAVPDPEAQRLTAARPIHVTRHSSPLGDVPNALFLKDSGAFRRGDIIDSRDRKSPFSKRTQT